MGSKNGIFKLFFSIPAGSTIGELIDTGAEKWGNDREAIVSVHQVGLLNLHLTFELRNI